MEMKLLYILNHYSKNSAQHFFHVLNLLEKMADKGVKIILVIEKCDSKVDVHNPNIQVVAQKEKSKVKRLLELRSILNTYLEQGYRKIFVRISLNAAVIAIRLAKYKGGEVYYWQSGDNLTYDLQKSGKEKIKYLITNHSKLLYIKNHVDHFVTGPKTMIDYYQYALKINPRKMTLLYNDINLNRFSVSTEEERSELRKKMGIDSQKKIILFVHRLTPVKRFYLQLPYVIEREEFRKQNALLIIVGNGPDYNRVCTQVEQSNYKDLVKVIGTVPNREIMDYYKIADVFINPSYSEGFPRVILEAMACGLPVVASDVGGTCDIVGELQRQFIFDKDDRDCFREAVLTLLKNPEIRSQISQENQRTVKAYSTEMVSEMYISKIFNKNNLEQYNEYITY